MEMQRRRRTKTLRGKQSNVGRYRGAQEIDDEKLYDGAWSVYDVETYGVQYAIQSSVPQSASVTSHSPQLSLFASLRTFTLSFAGGILAAFSFYAIYRSFSWSNVPASTGQLSELVLAVAEIRSCDFLATTQG
jgi:hypothetical protein